MDELHRIFEKIVVYVVHQSLQNKHSQNTFIFEKVILFQRHCCLHNLQFRVILTDFALENDSGVVHRIKIPIRVLFPAQLSVGNALAEVVGEIERRFLLFVVRVADARIDCVLV